VQNLINIGRRERGLWKWRIEIFMLSWLWLL